MAGSNEATAEATKRVSAARAAHKREEERLRSARADVERLSLELDATDPDSDGFGKLVHRREEARARAEVLKDRLINAEIAVANAEEAAETTRRQATLEQLTHLDAKIAQLDASLKADARAFTSNLTAKVGELAEVVEQANALANQLGENRRSAAPWPAQVLPVLRSQL